MPVDTATATERKRAAAAATEDAAAQDVYVKLKSLQKHMEFLDIQVGARVVRGKGGAAGQVVFGRTLFSI